MDIRNPGWLVIVATFSSLSCGDAVAPPPEGALSVSVTTSSIATSGYCSPAFTMTLSNGTAPDPTASGDLLVDGQNGAVVTCKVKGSATYQINGSIRYKSSWLTLDGSLNADGTEGTARVSLWYQNGVGDTLVDPNCTIKLGAGKYAVESGALWANISCSELKAERANPNLWCAANGTIILKSCDD